ncbi:ElyC/SanA/YdcF family protein [Roseofilum sp. BLCC_M91]|uniref:ElyC/SanA/YdcF family protein n=1 Tax=Roseofilum halophilum BLCC-M91 TaxID=3022259 RepID=A0ABT7BG19_9CYAN|nr:ElyC/SanA/YdcF family protein [Roseofilum halophilum]MDJ1178126.1 ElyC/SanA/YdcF family protein [Roseofilum halophilum BLCC-M91]
MKIWARLTSPVLRRWLRLGTWVLLSLMIVVGSGWAIATSQKLSIASQSPLDAYLMLGGSIRREMHITQVAKDHPNLPILISQGADDPCIVRLFEVNAAPQNQVWLERCANATFENFYYTLPILKNWGVHHLQMITSARHLPRAQWLGQIILGSHGIWMETYTVKEKGIPGNTESPLKTALDVVRSLIWAGISQFYQPSCDQLYRLVDSDVQEWIEKGYNCEHQWDLRHIFKNMP